jgi:hypothetical protein
LNAGAVECFGNGDAPDIGGRERGKGTTHLSDGGTGSGNDV